MLSNTIMIFIRKEEWSNKLDFISRICFVTFMALDLKPLKFIIS